jgi:1-acyl-sn-glycerol-3-phosphate acyltransferase
MVTAVAGDASASLAMARRFWAPGALAILGARLRVAGVERISAVEPALFVANHRSNLDVPALFAALPRNLRFVVKAEIAKVPWLGWYVKKMGMVLVDRRERMSARRCPERVAQLLRARQSVVAFPEGSRSADPIVRPFRPGVFAAAIQTGTPVVPVAIRGSAAVWPARGQAIRPGGVLISFGEPLPTVGLQRGDLRRLSEAARRSTQELLDLPCPDEPCSSRSCPEAQA